MSLIPLDLSDLEPKEAVFKVSSFERSFTLCRWSLRIRAWATKEYGSQRLKEIFELQQISEIAELAWFMLKDDDKKFFENNKDKFLDAIASVKDQIALSKALMQTVGLGEPEFEKIQQALQKKSQTPT